MGRVEGTNASAFANQLRGLNPRPDGRRWHFVPYDQLSDRFGPLALVDPSELGIVLVECPSKAARRPYHKQKLALVLTSMRHFAVEQAARGVAVKYLVADSYAGALASVGPLTMMRPAERELRQELEPLVRSGQLVQKPHEGWLTSLQDFLDARAAPPWRMDQFYRHVRRRLDILMDRGRPVGGRFSFDGENRRPWRGTPAAPVVPTFEVDAITAEVCDLVRSRFDRHPGRLTPEALPASSADVARSWQWAKDECLQHFGPFEDAMSSNARSLFHTRISPLLNLQRLSAHDLLREVLALELPIASKEGFVRQLLGWREFMHHVHEVTDGFRSINGTAATSAKAAGDGGYRQWKGHAWNEADSDGLGGSLASALGSNRGLPPAYWGERSGLRCLDEVVTAVWEDGYSHHITRLMVLANIATLLDVSPRELTDWFWVAYIDAYDWVVEPNVHAMGTFGVGDLITTKPYIAGSAYIHKMSDFCAGCRFNPKTTCPLPSLYWAFIGRHRGALGGVDRMTLPVLAESRRSEAQRRADAERFEEVSAALAHGNELLVPIGR